MMKKVTTAIIFVFIFSVFLSAYAFANGFEEYNDYFGENGTYSYYFEQGITVTMSEEWYQNTIVKAYEDRVIFCHKDSYEKYAEEGIENGGRLFTISYSVNSNFKNLDEMTYIGFDAEKAFNYYATKPTDYQAYASDSGIKAEYDALFKSADDVIAGVKVLSSAKMEIGSLCELHGVYTDNANNRESYSYDLPLLKGDTTYIAGVNEELNLIYDKVIHSFTQMEKGYSLGLKDVSWYCEEYNDITSIIVSESFDDDTVYYHFFNLDKDGNQVSNEQILAAAGLTEEEFMGRAYAIIDRFMTRDDFNERPDLKELWDKAREKTLSEENCNEHLPLFLAADGSLIFCAKCDTIAGAGWYSHLFALSGADGFSISTADNLLISLSE